MNESLPPVVWSENLPLRLAAVVTLLCAALALAFAGLIPMPVCLLTLALIGTAGLVAPKWIPVLVEDSRPRTVTAMVTIGLLILATTATGPQALSTGGLTGPLGAAVTELGLPIGIPIGLLAALAAGALVAVALELGDRRGVQSALVLGIAVLGLASVAAPGTDLLPALVPGWPAAMFALTRLAASRTTVAGPPPPAPTAVDRMGLRTSRPGRPVTRGSRPPVMERSATDGSPVRALLRWQVLPVVVVITGSLMVLGLAVASGVATIGDRLNRNFSPGGGIESSAGRSTSDYLGGSMDLTNRGALSSDPVLDVGIDSPRLWRAGTLDEYTGRSWLANVAPTVSPGSVGPDGTVELVDPTSTASPAGSRTDQARPLRSAATQVLAPGRLLAVTSSALSSGAKLFPSPGDQIAMFGGGGSLRYQVRSQLLPAVDDPQAAATLTPVAGSASDSGAGAPPSGVDEALDRRWIALPSSVPERVLTLGRSLVSAAPSRLAAVQAIEAELANRMTYRLDSPVPGPGADAVDDVLFVSHSGFCEQFASAEVVLLRAAGVPARMAVGFSGGDPGTDGFRTMTRADAHAWVEVWFPGAGWVTSDPTPAADESPSRWPSIRAGLVRFLTGPAGWITITALVLLGPAVGLLLYRRRARRVAAAVRAGRSVDPDLADAFARLEADLLTEGRPRAPSETVAALADRLARQDGGTAPDPALAQALLVLERALYAPLPPSRQECLTAAGAIDRRAAAGSAVPSR